MPASPHLERLTLDDEGTSRDVVLLAEHTLTDGTVVVLLVPEDAFDDPSDDMDAWIRTSTGSGDDRALADLDDDDAITAAWDAFEEVLALTFSEDAG